MLQTSPRSGKAFLACIPNFLQGSSVLKLAAHTGWTKSCTTLKPWETTCLLVVPLEASSQGFLGGAKWISQPSTVLQQYDNTCGRRFLVVRKNFVRNGPTGFHGVDWGHDEELNARSYQTYGDDGYALEFAFYGFPSNSSPVFLEGAFSGCFWQAKWPPPALQKGGDDLVVQQPHGPSASCFQVPDCDVKGLRLFLDLLYTGGTREEVAVDMALAALDLAHRWQEGVFAGPLCISITFRA